MTNKEYSNFVDKKAPKSKTGRNVFNAFCIGGIICCIGQGFLEMYKHFGLDEKSAGAATSITMIFLGALLTGLKIYDNIAKVAGAGTIVPITGFANSIVSPAMEFKSEGFVLGMSGKMFSIAGLVLVFGISSSIILGIIYKLLGV